MLKNFILSIDQGTTGSTALVVDDMGLVRGRASSEFPQYFPRPGWVEHNGNEIWEVTHRVMGQAMKSAGVEPAAIAALGITNQRETSLLWDRKSGEPVGRAIVWQDRRTAKICEALRGRGLEEAWSHKTGLLLDPYFSGTKIHWMLEHNPSLKRRAGRGELAFGTIDSWLVWKLSGGALHVSDVTNASRTLLYDIRRLCWDDDILATLGIDKKILPQVVSSSGVVGHTAPEFFFGQKTPIAGIAGDQHAALFGQCCFEAGDVKNTYGTGCFMLMHTGRTALESRHRLLTTPAWKLGDEPVEYALEGSVFVAGAAIQWLRDGLNIIESASECEAMARSLEDNGDVYFVPALTGLGAPYWDPQARGTIVGLTRGTTRAHLVRAALEAMAYQTCDVARAMSEDSGSKLKILRADGGAAANTFTLQFQSDLLGCRVEVPEVLETTAYGAALLAGLGVGLWQDRDELRALWKPAVRYEPAVLDGKSEDLYLRWRQAVERSRGWAKP